MLITQKMLNLKCLFHGKVMRVYKLLFYPSKKSVNFCYYKVSLTFFQKGFVRMILKIVLASNKLLVVDLIIQLYIILYILTTQLRINFRSGPLEEMCKVLQKNLMKYVMNFFRNEENEISLKKIHCCIGSWTSQGLLTLSISQTAIFIAASIVRDYGLKTLVKTAIFIVTHCKKGIIWAEHIY